MALSCYKPHCGLCAFLQLGNEFGKVNRCSYSFYKANVCVNWTLCTAAKVNLDKAYLHKQLRRSGQNSNHSKPKSFVCLTYNDNAVIVEMRLLLNVFYLDVNKRNANKIYLDINLLPGLNKFYLN